MIIIHEEDVRDMIWDLLYEIDHDIAKDYDHDLSEDPDLAIARFSKLQDIIESYHVD